MPADGGYRRGFEATGCLATTRCSPRLGRVFVTGPDAALSADEAVLCALVSDAYLAPSQPLVRAYRVQVPATNSSGAGAPSGTTTTAGSR
jgi:hypothetical protein